MINLNSTARLRFLVGLMVVSLVAVAGCGGGEKTDAEGSGGDAADATSEQQIDHNVGRATLAGVSFVPPGHWVDLGPSGMRQAQYRLDPVEGDPAQAEVNVFYFGENSGGGVQANLDRWIGQMVLPEGADPETAITRENFQTAEGMAGHIVALNGSYKSGGGRPMGGDGELLAGYRLVGVVLEGPEGSLFFKLTGPKATAEAMEKDLITMVRTARKK